METPDILNSKTNKIRIELPHYSFSHSASGDSSQPFIGRERIREKLKKVIEDSPDESGVYLVAGNRGVGKTSLVSEVIKETSLQPNSKFTENLRYLAVILLAVIGTQFCLQEFPRFAIVFWFSLPFSFAISFSTLCHFNAYRYKIKKYVHGEKKKCLRNQFDCIISAIKELSYLINPHTPYKSMHYLLKIILVVCYTQICSQFSSISPTQVFVFYLWFIFTFMFWRYIKDTLRKNYQKYMKKESLKNSIYNTENTLQIIFYCCSALLLLLLPLLIILKSWNEKPLIVIIPVLMFVPFISVLISVIVLCYRYLKKDERVLSMWKILTEPILNPIKNYVKNHNRLYLRINFGHKLKEEKDILRLITRTLSTEYSKYRRSFWRMLPWRIIALVFCLVFAHLFSTVVKEQKSYQGFCNLIKNWECLDITFSKTGNNVKTKVKTNIETNANNTNEILGERTSVETNVNTKVNTKVGNLLRALDGLVFEIKVKTKNAILNIWKKDVNHSKEGVLQINYLFWLSFLLIYLFCVLVSCNNTITHFFVTHKIIKRRLKKLNRDITYSTERESSIHVNSVSTGTNIGTSTKNIRNVADAREIEKDLQDILDDIRRIPVFMCRPNVVIVFDELDKVEPGDINQGKGGSQTKASMLSIGATRERQTEILRILSNMKYFLSTVRAKFVFIAGHEMFDIHLADVSERNNYIGSIFNTVIYVPSFLTDHPTGKDSLREESSIASLSEEFVCRRLIPHEYQVESYDLRNYQMYLQRDMFGEIKQRIENIISHVNKREKNQVRKIIDDGQCKEIQKIITKQNKAMVQKLKDIIISKKKDKVGQEIKKTVTAIGSEKIAEIRETFITPNERIIAIVTERNKEIAREIQNIISDIHKQHEEIQKIIAVLQQFIIYLVHVSKGAPKKMMQLLESFIEVSDKNNRNKEKNLSIVRHYYCSVYFLTFNYYKQYTLGVIAYLITPIFYRLSESNIKEHSDKLLVSILRFVDFLFKFHKHSFTWKHLEISPEMMEPNRAPELKSVAVDLLNYLAQIHINKSNFSLYDYKYDSWIANEIFTMTKTDDVFSALFSFSLDEMLPLKKHYQSLLEGAEKEYADEKNSTKYIDAISSLQIVLGDLCYYDDELEEAGVYYKNAVEMLRKEDKGGGMSPGRLYLCVRNKLKIGMIHEKRRQYDFTYQTYGELCEQIISERKIMKTASLLLQCNVISSDNYNEWSKKTTYEGLKMLYLPFIAKFQILEKSHIGGIGSNHLKLLEEEFGILTENIKNKELHFLKAEFFSRVADILYYKNSDLKQLQRNTGNSKKNDTGNYPCTVCHYYRKALSTLLKLDNTKSKYDDNIIELLRNSIEQIENSHNMQHCTILARILSDWGNVFFSCDNRATSGNMQCYIGNNKIFNTPQYCCQESICHICGIKKGTPYSYKTILDMCLSYVKSNSNRELFLKELDSKNNFLKMEIVFAMYSVSSEAYRKANLYKRSASQLYKMLCLFKHYKLYRTPVLKSYIEQLSEKAIHYLWHANDDLSVYELNKRKKDFDMFDKFDENKKESIKAKDLLPSLLVDSDITKIRILVKELELEAELTPQKLNDCYARYITSPYRINYSIGGRIYRLRLKSIVNNKAYRMLVNDISITDELSEIERILAPGKCDQNLYEIFGTHFGIKGKDSVTLDNKVEILDNLIAETIYCLIDIVQLSKTMGETHVFTHSFLGFIHEDLSLWIRRYKAYNEYKNGNPTTGELSLVDRYLEKYLDEEWRELISGYRENEQALSYYYKSLEMHSGGRAYHTAIDTMCYVKDDYNDRTDHFNIAEERHLICNGVIGERINRLKGLYKDFYIYDPNNYYEQNEKPAENDD
jgi:hypothetical protein